MTEVERKLVEEFVKKYVYAILCVILGVALVFLSIKLFLPKQPQLIEVNWEYSEPLDYYNSIDGLTYRNVTISGTLFNLGDLSANNVTITFKNWSWDETRHKNVVTCTHVVYVGTVPAKSYKNFQIVVTLKPETGAGYNFSHTVSHE